MTTPTFSAKLPDVTIQQLNELAAQFGVSKSQIVVQAVRQLYQQEIKTMNTERINLDDNTDVDWQGAGHYAAYIGKERYIWKRDDDPNNEPVYVTNWKQLIGKEYTTPKRY